MSMTKQKTKTVAVVGLGYVGLPVAILAAAKGWRVIGLDKDANKVAAINAGRSPLNDAQLNKQLKKVTIEATTDPVAIKQASHIIVAVPTPVSDGNLPDLTPLKSAVESLCPHLQPGQSLIIESTINPGVTDEIIVPILRKQPGLVLDVDGYSRTAVCLAHCPERINPGDSQWTVRNIPRVIGGYSNPGVTKAKSFYDSIVEAPIKRMNSIQEAEAVKILENTFRDINIAFINEMAKSFAKLNIDILNVIAGAATKPFAFLPHYPGNGVGGHCISVDPYYMIERGRKAGFDHEFLKLARRINDSMPAYTVELLLTGWEKLSVKSSAQKVALLGLAYKKNIDDLRESPALEIKRLLENKKISINIYDPYAAKQSTVNSLDQALVGASAVMLACDHDEFTKKLTPDYLKSSGIQLVIDGKNALDGDGIAAAGIYYYGIGRKRLPAIQ
ncbi:MAG: nucleotide sugar dehydrogenase [bacterium]|nr:nucleotide sugar dehydrogenase [bacterium]